MSRIPQFKRGTKKGFQEWCDKMAKAGLLYHFEEKPEDILKWGTSEPLFTKEECKELRLILGIAFKCAKFDVMKCALEALNKELEGRKSCQENSEEQD